MEITLHTAEASCSISDHGAELRSFVKDGREYMWQADPAYWGRTAPVLFPFVGQVAGKKYRVGGTEYTMGQHGFARDKDFTLVEKTDTTCRFLLKSTEETRSVYPFDFELTIAYRLSGSTLTTYWEVKNPSDTDLHFSIGAHPAFNCDFATEKGWYIGLKKDGLPVTQFTQSLFGDGLLTHITAERELNCEGTALLNQRSFDGDAWVIEHEQVNQVTLINPQGNPVVELQFTAPLVGIWSPPKKNAPFICIEPWYGRADKEGFSGDISEREWNNTLKSGEIFSVKYDTTVF